VSGTWGGQSSVPGRGGTAFNQGERGRAQAGREESRLKVRAPIDSNPKRRGDIEEEGLTVRFNNAFFLDERGRVKSGTRVQFKRK